MTSAADSDDTYSHENILKLGADLLNKLQRERADPEHPYKPGNVHEQMMALMGAMILFSLAERKKDTDPTVVISGMAMVIAGYAAFAGDLADMVDKSIVNIDSKLH